MPPWLENFTYNKSPLSTVMRFHWLFADWQHHKNMWLSIHWEWRQIKPPSWTQLFIIISKLWILSVPSSNYQLTSSIYFQCILNSTSFILPTSSHICFFLILLFNYCQLFTRMFTKYMSLSLISILIANRRVDVQCSNIKSEHIAC